ncbi:hypothetical protein LJC58_03135 [Lachnospiraceae bacterium OttesenSCG-928-D06]|nr:hypothetical protein [Lachnospiraceae bacterium OttesenSCG-928-D06]
MAAKKATNAETVQTTAEPIQFSKEQILASAKFANRRDLVDALLDEKGKYTMEQVDELVNSFLKGKVK